MYSRFEMYLLLHYYHYSLNTFATGCIIHKSVKFAKHQCFFPTPWEDYLLFIKQQSYRHEKYHEPIEDNQCQQHCAVKLWGIY